MLLKSAVSRYSRKAGLLCFMNLRNFVSACMLRMLWATWFSCWVKRAESPVSPPPILLLLDGCLRPCLIDFGALKAAISAFLESRGPNRAQARNPRAGPSRVLASRHTGRAPSMESSKTSRHTPQKTARKHPRAATKMCTVTSQMQQSRRRADATPSPKQVRNPLINRYASRTRASSAWTRSGVKYSPAGNEARQA